MSEGTKFANLNYPDGSRPAWARYWNVSSGIVIHVFSGEGQSGQCDIQEEVVKRLNRVDGVRNVGDIPGELHRSVVRGTRQVYITSYILLSELEAAVLAVLQAVLGVQNVILAENRTAPDEPA